MRKYLGTSVIFFFFFSNLKKFQTFFKQYLGKLSELGLWNGHG